MTRWLLSLLFLLLAAPTWAATGSAAVDTWYVRPTGACANNGDGLAYACAAGAGATGAFIGLTNVIYTATTGVDDGDTLYVCGQHLETLFPAIGTAGTTTTPIYFNFSCPSDRGSIRKSTIMTEGLTGGNWTDEGGNLWYLSLAAYAAAPSPHRLWLSGTEELPASAKIELGTQEGGVGPISRWWYDSGNARLYVYATANPATLYNAFESLVSVSIASCGYTALCFPSSTRAYIHVINPILEGGNTAALTLLGAPIGIRIYGTTVSECTIGARSPSGVRFTDANGNGTGVMPIENTVSYCTIDPVIPTALQTYGYEWNFDGWGDGVHFRFGGTANHVQHNVIRDWPHASLNVVATVGTNAITGNAIELNTMTCVIAYCRGVAVDGTSDGLATGNSIRANTIDGMATRSQFNGNGNALIGNLFINQRCEAVTGIHRCESLDMEGYTGSISHDNFILNNTFANNLYAPCISFKAGTNTKSGFIVANNLLYNCGGTALTGKEQIALYVQADASVGNQTFQNNSIYDAANTATVFYKASGAVTVSAFQSACSGDVCAGNLATDPLVVNTTDDFHTLAASPLRRAGRTGYVCLDVRGRPCWTPPDIGAYQATHGDLVMARTAASARAVRSATP